MASNQPVRISGPIKVTGQIVDATKNNQLVLRFIGVLAYTDSKTKGYDFYSLSWETKNGDSWSDKVLISRADFEKGSQQRRWISGIGAFNHETGRAILQVGEESPRESLGTIHVVYSWREWDIAKNQEVRLIRVCENPLEPFGDVAIKNEVPDL